MRRAGVLKKRSRTSIVVPNGCAAGFGCADLAAVARDAPRVLGCPRYATSIVMRATEPMLGSASPRNPSDVERLEIVERRDLARRVARQRERELVARECRAPSSVTRISARPAAFDLDLDRARAGVERVLDELLDDGRRPLDDLARGDLVDELRRQNSDGHAKPFARDARAERSEASVH